MTFDWGQLGLAGVIILVLAGVVLRLYNENKALYEKLNSLQESRRQDAIDTRDKLGEQMEILNKTIGLIYDKLINGRR